MDPLDRYFARNILVDVYPRKDDPFRPSSASGAPSETDTVSTVQTLTSGFITPPGQRPYVYQRGVSFNFTAGVAALPINANRYEVDSVIVDVPSTAANSVFMGFAGVTITSGLEVRPGLPIEWATDNTREQWELQRAMELIASLLAMKEGGAPLTTYRPPRVVYNLADIFIVAAAPTAISITVFNVPEQQ